MTKFKNIALALVAFVLLSATANATTLKPVDSLNAEEPFTVKFLGNEGEYLLFEVVVKSNDARHTSFEVSDKTEGEIYATSIKSNYKVQTLKIERRNDQQLDFKLMIGDNVYSKSFAILAPVTMEAK